ncbi:MAG: hypothetical protein HN742_13220 [Lentisphaerae bacterium]|jgi:hypothetical protein|nr:hypothetical protein [Lentisphaerota bacterium]MBT4819905.1 hypothetical protein [Lentisphaerota bacterium]MBT5608174.1 hypothetical protein [Lentisphaerota bacterium]MBT7058937.1 hypothetical protein [Lentisphaerota bacterium]MBT7842832.1 hypothetical protein [Lentisphaerota bacterium]
MSIEGVITGLPDLPPSAVAPAASSRPFAGEEGTLAETPRDVYLRAAREIIDQAVAWVDDRGFVIDPVEGSDDRWQGGTSARFVCPASVLIAESGRTDLVPVVSRCFDQLSTGILKHAADGGPFPPGVLDLTIKEMAVAWHLMTPHTSEPVHRRWGDALAALRASAVFVVEDRLRAGTALHNYGVSAAVGEWLRHRFGLSGDPDWVECVLGWEMPLFTAKGMYRDPGDPMLYDLMVRQNLSELMEWGYDGTHAERIRELLRRSGGATLHMLSPCGYAPYGGRSNGLLHNEAMLCYLCEHQRRQATAASSSATGGTPFALAAAAAVRACLPYLQETPLRYIKNWFPPASRHGKDGAYGEYANYGLLAASLFARTALMAPRVLSAPLSPSKGTPPPGVLSLWPEFHKVFINCGGTHMEIDTRAQSNYDATGLGRLQHTDAPPGLALSASIPGTPAFLTGAGVPGRAACIGPVWQTADGAWVSLAETSRSEIEDVNVVDGAGAPEAAEATIRWSFHSEERLPVGAVTQAFLLTQKRLRVAVALQGVCRQAGYEIPCFVTDGRRNAETTVTPVSLVVCCDGWEFAVAAPQATNCALEDTLRANRFGLYRVARFSLPTPSFEVELVVRRAQSS